MSFEKKRPAARPEEGEREQRTPRDDLVIGRNAVRETLKSGRPADSLLVAKGERTGAALPILAECRERGIPIKEVDKTKLDYMCGHENHQGMILIAAAHAYATVEEILRLAEEKGEPPFLVICDSLEDPHNLGAILRSAEAGGVHGVIIPERRSVSLSGIVGKTSAGALEYVPVARVKNLTAEIRALKERGIWVYAADMDGADYRKSDLSGPIALVIGSEGSGVSRLVKETCDGCLRIPMKGQINSLNASVAAALLIFGVSAARDAEAEKMTGKEQSHE